MWQHEITSAVLISNVNMQTAQLAKITAASYEYG